MCRINYAAWKFYFSTAELVPSNNQKVLWLSQSASQIEPWPRFCQEFVRPERAASKEVKGKKSPTFLLSARLWRSSLNRNTWPSRQHQKKGKELTLIYFFLAINSRKFFNYKCGSTTALIDLALFSTDPLFSSSFPAPRGYFLCNPLSAVIGSIKIKFYRRFYCNLKLKVYIP